LSFINSYPPTILSLTVVSAEPTTDDAYYVAREALSFAY